MSSNEPQSSPNRPRLRDCWNALKTLSYGVYVVSCRAGEGEEKGANAMTARFMTQVSTRPPRVALSIAKARLTHELILKNGLFAVSVLGEGQEMMAGHFGLRSGRQADKWLEVESVIGEHTGAPILAQCTAWFECRVEAVHDMGACSLIVAEVIGGGAHGSEPLVYKEEDYFG